MTEELATALKAVRDILQKEAHAHCSSVSVFFNCEGYKIDYNLRSPGSLKRSGISMRNIKGEWIKETDNRLKCPDCGTLVSPQPEESEKVLICPNPNCDYSF